MGLADDAASLKSLTSRDNLVKSKGKLRQFGSNISKLGSKLKKNIKRGKGKGEGSLG